MARTYLQQNIEAVALVLYNRFTVISGYGAEYTLADAERENDDLGFAFDVRYDEAVYINPDDCTRVTRCNLADESLRKAWEIALALVAGDEVPA